MLHCAYQRATTWIQGLVDANPARPMATLVASRQRLSPAETSARRARAHPGRRLASRARTTASTSSRSATRSSKTYSPSSATAWRATRRSSSGCVRCSSSCARHAKRASSPSTPTSHRRTTEGGECRPYKLRRRRKGSEPSARRAVHLGAQTTAGSLLFLRFVTSRWPWRAGSASRRASARLKRSARVDRVDVVVTGGLVEAELRPRSPPRSSTRRRSRGHAEVLEDAPGDALVLDDGNEPHRPLALSADEHVHRVRPLQQDGPAQPTRATGIIGRHDVITPRTDRTPCGLPRRDRSGSRHVPGSEGSRSARTPARHRRS